MAYLAQICLNLASFGPQRQNFAPTQNLGKFKYDDATLFGIVKHAFYGIQLVRIFIKRTKIHIFWILAPLWILSQDGIFGLDLPKFGLVWASEAKFRPNTKSGEIQI